MGLTNEQSFVRMGQVMDLVLACCPGGLGQNCLQCQDLNADASEPVLMRNVHITPASGDLKDTTLTRQLHIVCSFLW